MIVGIIGPSDSGYKVEKYLKEIDKKLDIKLYIRENVSDTSEVIEQCELECDAIIYTGCGVAEEINSKYDVKKPYSFISRGGTSILKAFYEVKDANISLERFSIDVVENRILEDIVSEMNIKPKRVYSLPFSSEIDEMEYTKWHIDLYKQNKIDVMFTGFGGVYREIKS